MTREEKSIAIEGLTAQLASSNIVYLADISGLNAETTSNLRRACFKAGMKLEVVKNTLLAKAMEASDNDYGDLPSVLKGNTAIYLFLIRLMLLEKLSKNFVRNQTSQFLKVHLSIQKFTSETTY
jgi:ribosomal protein L10